MSPQPSPDPGTTITFLNTDPECAELFRRGVATGPAVHDPRTDQDWIPVVCPDRSRILVHQKLVVEGPAAGSLPRSRMSKTPEAVRHAVIRWTCHVVLLVGSPCPRWDEAVVVLEGLLVALSPMRGTMRALAEVNPSGELADVVKRLTEATWQLNEGDLRATRDALTAGATALARYLEASG
jgi:hypothetical protein